MPEVPIWLVGLISVVGPSISAWWVSRQARRQSQAEAVAMAERLTRIEAALASLVESTGRTERRLNDHAERLRHIEISHAANHGGGSSLKDVAHA